MYIKNKGGGDDSMFAAGSSQLLVLNLSHKLGCLT